MSRLRLSILVLTLLALTVDSKHKHHQKEKEPEFIRNLTQGQRSSFFGISKNPGFSIQQKEEKLESWAKANNLTTQYAEFEKTMTVHREELSKNVTGVVERLSAAKVEVDKVFADKSLTKIQQHDKIADLKKTYPQEIPALFYIGGLFEHPEREEHHGKGGKKHRDH